MASVNSATANAIATLKIGNPGVIVGVQWALHVLGGASVDGRTDVELSISNTSNITQNDTPNNVVSQCNIAENIISSAFACTNYIGGLAFPVDLLDNLYLNLIHTGTALTSALICCFIYVLEK